MKGIIFLISEKPSGKKVVYKHIGPAKTSPAPEAQSPSSSAVLQRLKHKFPSLILGEEDSISPQNKRAAMDEKHDDKTSGSGYFGFSKQFFTELFIPKETT